MKLQELLIKHGIKYLWHFTDMSNLDSIQKNSLLSLEKIELKKIDVTCFGADELSHSLDRASGLDKYVHLAFLPDHPMYHVKKRERVITQPIWLKIDISVLCQENVYYSNEVANSSNAKLFKANQIENIIDFEKIMHPIDFKSKITARKAEILIPNQIELKDIKGFYHG